MKQKARLLLTVLFAMVAVSVFAGGWLKVTGNSVRLRLAPGGADSGLRMDKGDKLEWYSYDDGWYSVQYGENIYYISSKYVERISQEQTQKYVVVTGDRVIMRKTPGGKDSGLRANDGDRFKYLGEQGDWLKIQFKGNAYWVSKKYAVIKQ